MSEIVDLAQARAALARSRPADEPRGWVIGFRYCRSIAQADPYDPPEDPGRVDDVRQIGFDFAREDAIAARLHAAWEAYAAARQRETELLAEIVELRHGPETVA